MILATIVLIGSHLIESLDRELGDGYEIRYPRMPQEDKPNYGSWADAIRA